MPGDLILLDDLANSSLPCDLVLISGYATVSEAMLSGESIPITKTAFNATDLTTTNGCTTIDFGECLKNSILFAGSQLLQTRVGVDQMPARVV